MREALPRLLCSLLDTFHMKGEVEVQTQGFNSIKSPLSKCQRKNSTVWLFLPFAVCRGSWLTVLTRLVRRSSLHGLTKLRTSKVLEKLGLLRAGRGAQCIHLKLASTIQRTRGRFLSWFGESINTTVVYQLYISPTDTSLYLPALNFVQSAEHLSQRVCCDRLTGMSLR